MGSNWQDQDDVEPTVDEAIAHVVSLFATYDEQSKYIQKRLDYFAAQQGPKIFKQYEDKLRERNQQDEAKAQAARRLKAQERKRIRDIAIPEWCEANLKPGMVIMVKASNTKMRQVEKITPGKTYPNGHHFTGSVTGRHVLFGRSRDPETNEINIFTSTNYYIGLICTKNDCDAIVLWNSIEEIPIITVMTFYDHMKIEIFKILIYFFLIFLFIYNLYINF